MLRTIWSYTLTLMVMLTCALALVWAFGIHD